MYSLRRNILCVFLFLYLGITNSYANHTNKTNVVEKILIKGTGATLQRSLFKKTTNFQEINKPFSFKMQDYIKKIVDNDRDLDGPKIFVANIHKIKGLEYDNVILDQKLTRPESLI